MHVFRLAGIYGPGRGPLEKVRAPDAKRIIKPGQVFGRIHVEDIATVLQASMARPDPGAVYNVTDDLTHARPKRCWSTRRRLLGIPVASGGAPFEDADLSPMARSFYGESKRVSNARRSSATSA